MHRKNSNKVLKRKRTEIPQNDDYSLERIQGKGRIISSGIIFLI